MTTSAAWRTSVLAKHSQEKLGPLHFPAYGRLLASRTRLRSLIPVRSLNFLLLCPLPLANRPDCWAVFEVCCKRVTDFGGSTGLISSFESSNFWYLFPFWFLEHLFSGESFKDRVIVNFIASKYEEEISSNGKKFNFAETGASKELQQKHILLPLSKWIWV